MKKPYYFKKLFQIVLLAIFIVLLSTGTAQLEGDNFFMGDIW